MIKSALILLASLLAGNAFAQGRVLTAYFSHTGVTAALAGQIHALAGGDIFEIKTLQAYPKEYKQCTALAQKELRENARPILLNAANIEAYDVIFLGYPCWWGTTPMALFTFLESTDFSGKTIIPFSTHGGSGFSRSLADITKLAPKASLKKGFSLKNGSQANSQELKDWLQLVLINTNNI